ncbi:MAG: PQQ-binding-like beta-propeller repeat protein, partial [Verrucomicrobiota bacterium]
AGTGANIAGGKSNQFSVAPVFADGRVFTFTPMRRVFAYDARTGEKLWASPPVEAFEARKAKALEAGRMIPTGGPDGIPILQSHLQVADGVLLTPTGEGYDVETGEKRWTSEAFGTGWKHYTVWRHEQKEYFLANVPLDHDTLNGELRLIDPRTGQPIWRHPIGWSVKIPMIGNDVVVIPVRASKVHPQWQVWGGVRLRPEGAENVWELPDDLTFLAGAESRSLVRHVAVTDHLALIFQNRLRIKTPTPEQEKRYGTKLPRRERGPVHVVRLHDGKLLNAFISQAGQAPLVVGNRLLVQKDVTHGGRFAETIVYEFDPETGRHELMGPMPLEHWPITAYDRNFETPVIDGLYYSRSIKGIDCYDLKR